MNTRPNVPGRGVFPVRLPAFGILFVDSYWGASYGFDPAYLPFPPPPPGPHVIEILSPGYEPLVMDITVTPGRTTTYRGTLNRARN
jgi:hypothetical protein